MHAALITSSVISAVGSEFSSNASRLDAKIPHLSTFKHASNIVAIFLGLSYVWEPFQACLLADPLGCWLPVAKARL